MLLFNKKYPNITPKGVMLMDLQPSNIKNKKWTASFKTSFHKNKTVHFGDSRYQDLTQHKNEDRARLYRLRHAKDNLNDPLSPGSLSMVILWSSHDFKQGLKNYIHQN